MTTNHKIVLAILLCLLLAACCLAYVFRASLQIAPGITTTSIPARLSVSGTQILDPNGNPIVLRGFVWGDPFNISQSNPNDAADNAAQGANAVRIAIRWWGQYGTDTANGQTVNIDSYDPNSPQTGYLNPGNLALLDKYVDLAAANHLWVDLFMESDCGADSQGKVSDQLKACGSVNGDGKTPQNFENDPAMLAKYTAAWEFLANHYKNQPYIGMYELLSEPGFAKCDTPDACAFTKSLYTGLINVVHPIDPATPFLVGPSGSYSAGKIANVYLGATTTPIIYTGDLLEGDPAGGNPGGSRHPEYIQEYFLPFMQQYDVPVFVQQVGVASGDSDAVSAANTILSTLNKAGIGWTWWEYRAAGNSMTSNAVVYENEDGSSAVKSGWLAVIEKYLKGAAQ